MQNYWKKILTVLLFVIYFVNNSNAQQASLEMFGQNRIQTKKFDWQYYDSTHFRVLYNTYGKFNAQYVIQQAEADIANIVYLMSARMPRKINIVLYNSYSDFKQSNIGRYNEDLLLGNGGTFDISNNSIAIYFDGTHKSLQQQTRRGIVNIIKDNLLYGYTLKEVVKNSVKMNIPQWFTQGYIEYISGTWTPENNSKLKSILGSRPKRKFEDFTIDNPKLLGHSFFNYIEKKYGDTKTNEILYVMRMRDNMDKAIELVLKTKSDKFFKEWKMFYYNTTDSILDAMDTLEVRKEFASIKPHKGATLKNFAISPNGTDVAYCEIKDGGYAIYLYNKTSKKTNKIISNEVKTNLDIFDPSYPIITWNNDGRKLAIMYERDFMQRLKVYDAKNGRISTRILTNNKFDRLNSMCFMDDDTKLVISAIKKGQSDLYQYTIKNARMTNITKDVWNDINPIYISRKGQEGILFMSNRPSNNTTVLIGNNELPNKPFHIYYYDAKTTSPILTKISDGIEVPISNPIIYSEKDFAFLVTEKNNTKQRYIASFAKDVRGRDSIYFYKSLEMPFSVQQQAYINKTNSVMEIVHKAGKYFIYNTPVKKLIEADSNNSLQTFNNLTNLENAKAINKNEPTVFYLSEFTNDIDSLDVTSTKKNTQILQANTNTVAPKKFRAKQYIATFSPDFLQTTPDNSILFNRYQNINQRGYGFVQPRLGGLLKLSLIDVLEDHKITAAVRLPTRIGSGKAYMLRYANYKTRLDWGLSFFRNSENFEADVKLPSQVISKELLKFTNTYIEANFVWPINVITSLRLNTGLRIDKNTFKISTENSSSLPNYSSIWNFNRLEYVIDNTAQSMYNIRKGTRLKIYADGLLQIKDTNKNSMYIVGIDVRHYEPIYKNFILATRLSNAYSGGKAKLLYALGGIDNEFQFFNKPNNNNLNLDATINYQYQTIATTLRGYAPNTAMGSSFGVLNNELRLPIANTVFNRNFRSKFLNEFQLVAFADVASAWAGFSPGGSYINYFSNPPTTQQYKTYFGYGLGARTKLFGYNIHADIAWNDEKLLPGQIRKPRIHLSTTQDF